MSNLAFSLWLGSGIFLMAIEFLSPGLVMVFVGLGSLTVVFGMHFGYIDGILQQFTTFFISSIIYLLTLRFLVLRFVPSVTRKENIDEDEEVMGSIVEIVAEITSGEFGRVEHSGSSWQARAEGDQTILKGEQVKIIGRENITWIVQKIYKWGDEVLSIYSGIIILICFIVYKTIIIVSERENIIVERLGKYQRTLTPGIYFLIPFIDFAAYKQEMREQVIDIPSQSVITKDNIQVEIDGLLYIKVMDPKKASYGIGNYLAASINLAQTTMRSEVGKITLGSIFSERDEVNAKIISEIDKASDPWGVKVLRYEIKDIAPSLHVVETLEKQMEAEREKRAEITRATAEKEKLINVSEGKRQSAINISEGEKQKRINEANGRAEGIKLIADSTAQSLKLVGEAIELPGGNEALKMRIIDQYIDQLDEVFESGDVSLFPANLASLKGIVEELKGNKSTLKGSSHVDR